MKSSIILKKYENQKTNMAYKLNRILWSLEMKILLLI